MKTGLDLISEARADFINEYGFIPNSEGYEKRELLDAALLYINVAMFGKSNVPVDNNLGFVKKYFKKDKSYIENLKMAAALIATELDRVQTN